MNGWLPPACGAHFRFFASCALMCEWCVRGHVAFPRFSMHRRRACGVSLRPRFRGARGWRATAGDGALDAIGSRAGAATWYNLVPSGASPASPPILGAGGYIVPTPGLTSQGPDGIFAGDFDGLPGLDLLVQWSADVYLIRQQNGKFNWLTPQLVVDWVDFFTFYMTSFGAADYDR